MKQDVFTRRQHTFLVLDADSLIETLQSMALFLPPFGSEDVIAATLACTMKNALHNRLHLFPTAQSSVPNLSATAIWLL